MRGIRKFHYIILFVTGLLLASAHYFMNPFSLEQEANKVVSVAVLMIAWWISEAIPMPVVALLPLILFPLLRIGSIEQTSKAYSNPVVFLFMGGFLIGLAIEKWNLHKRIALGIVKRTGTSGNRIILGFIIATGFISMWLSNTATTMMMFPIALSVIAALADALKLDPLTLGMPMTLAASAASMLPMGTPPNAIVFGSGYIRMKDMLLAGFVMNFISILLISLFCWLLLPVIMHLR